MTQALSDDSDRWLEDMINRAIGDRDFDEQTVTDVLRQITLEMVRDLDAEIVRESGAIIADFRSEIVGFRDRLREIWGPAFDALQSLILISRELAEMFATRRASEADDEELRFPVLARLVGRGLIVASEIQHLLEGGFAGGANTRWRTLHEIAVTAEFLSQADDSTVEQYVDFEAVDAYKDATVHQQHCDALGLEPLADSELDALQAERNRVVAEHGYDFKEGYGWAASALKRKRVTFADIEMDVAKDHLRPIYKLACHTIHAGARSLTWHPSIRADSENVMLAGPSNAGLGEPGMRTARSLLQLVAASIFSSPTVTNQMGLQVLLKATERTEAAFLDAEGELDSRTATTDDAMSASLEKVPPGKSPNPVITPSIQRKASRPNDE